MLGNTKENSKDSKSTEKIAETTNNNETNWEKVRADWLKSTGTKPKQFTKSKPVSDKHRSEIHETIRSVKAPYPSFDHYISLEEMIEMLLEVWEDDEDN